MSFRRSLCSPDLAPTKSRGFTHLGPVHRVLILSRRVDFCPLIVRDNGVDPDKMKITDLTPSAYFLVSKAAERLISAAIYSPGVTSFALMVERSMDPTPDPNANPGDPPKTIPPGLRWMPLHLISYSATFVSVSWIISPFLFLTSYF